MQSHICRITGQEFSAGSCLVEVDEKRAPACQVTLKYENEQLHRLVTSIHLSRPENYATFRAGNAIPGISAR